MNRRGFLVSSATGSALASGPSSGESAQSDIAILDEAASAPVLKLDTLTSPVSIESLELMQARGQYFTRFRIEGLDSAKVHPEASARWFERAAQDVLALVAQAEDRAGCDRSREFVSTVTDLRILARLAEYHSHRARAGLAYALFKHSREMNVLDDALRHEEDAFEAWERLVKDAGGVYTDDLAMGRASEGMAGHWRDELVPLRRGIEALRRQRRELAASLGQGDPSIAHVPVRRLSPREALLVPATVYGPEPAEVTLAVADETRAWRRVPMERTEPGLYRARMDAQEVSDAVAYFIETVDAGGRVMTWPAEGADAPVRLAITDDEEPPVVAHEPVANGSPGLPLTVTADVCDPSGVAWVRLRYRPVNQHFDYQTLDMPPAGQEARYEVTVPGGQVPTEWDFMYLIEAMDTKGNGAVYPNLECETPYVVVSLHGNRP